MPDKGQQCRIAVERPRYDSRPNHNGTTTFFTRSRALWATCAHTTTLPHYHRRDTCTCLNNTTPHSSLPYNASQRLGSSDPRSRRRHIPNFEQTINSNPHLHMPTSPRPGGRGGTYRWSLQLLQVSSSAHISVPFLELNCLFPKVYHELALHYHQGNLSAVGGPTQEVP